MRLNELSERARRAAAFREAWRESSTSIYAKREEGKESQREASIFMRSGREDRSLRARAAWAG